MVSNDGRENEAIKKAHEKYFHVLRFFCKKGATESGTWFYFGDGEFRLRMILLGFPFSFMSIAGVGRSSASLSII